MSCDTIPQAFFPINSTSKSSLKFNYVVWFQKHYSLSFFSRNFSSKGIKARNVHWWGSYNYSKRYVWWRINLYAFRYTSTLFFFMFICLITAYDKRGVYKYIITRLCSNLNFLRIYYANDVKSLMKNEERKIKREMMKQT